jgi:hypothetical protein
LETGATASHDGDTEGAVLKPTLFAEKTGEFVRGAGENLDEFFVAQLEVYAGITGGSVHG